MTSFDLVEARGKQLQRAMARAIPERVAGYDRPLQEDSWWDATMHGLGKTTEIISKSVGRVVFPDEAKYQEPMFGSNSQTTTGFNDLLQDAGMDPLVAAIVGIGAEFANPLDWTNKLKILGLTKTGKTASLLKGVGGVEALVKGADGLLKVDTNKMLDFIAKTKRDIASNKLAPLPLKHANASLTRAEKVLEQQHSLDQVLTALQKSGASLDALRLAPKFVDQVRLGQLSLIGLASPLSLEHLSLLGLGRGVLDDTTRANLLPKKVQHLMAKGLVGTNTNFIEPLGNTVKNIAQAIKLPLGKSTLLKKVGLAIKTISNKKHATLEEGMREYTSILNKAKLDGLTDDEITKVLQQLEIAPELKLALVDDLEVGIESSVLDTDIGKGVAIAGKGDLADETSLNMDSRLVLKEAGFDEDDIGSLMHELEKQQTSKELPPLNIVQRLGNIVKKRFDKGGYDTEVAVGVVIGQDGNARFVLSKGPPGANKVFIKPNVISGEAIITMHIHPGAGHYAPSNADYKVFNLFAEMTGKAWSKEDTLGHAFHLVIGQNNTYIVKFDKPLSQQEIDLFSTVIRQPSIAFSKLAKEGSVPANVTRDIMINGVKDIWKELHKNLKELSHSTSIPHDWYQKIDKGIFNPEDWTTDEMAGLIERGLFYLTSKDAPVKELSGRFDDLVSRSKKDAPKFKGDAEKAVNAIRIAASNYVESTLGIKLSIVSNAEADRLVSDFLNSGRKIEVLDTAKKLQLTPQGVDNNDLTVGIQQFKNAHATTSHYMGPNKEHEVRLLGEYVVVRTTSSKGKSGPLNELDKFFGNKLWVRHTDANGDTFLVAKRMPFSAPISEKNVLAPEHLINLEAIAAHLATKQKAFIGITPNDVLISPNGAVQIINPDVIVEMKSSYAAVMNSRMSLEDMRYGVSDIPYEFPYLKNVTTAKSLPRGVDAFRFRRINSDIENGAYMRTDVLLNTAANTRAHQEYIKASYEGKGSTEFEAANNILFHRKAIRDARAQNKAPNWAPIEVTQDDNGQVWVVGIDDRNRLTAAVLEGFDAVPVKKVEFFDHQLINDGHFMGRFLPVSDVLTGIKRGNNVPQHLAGVVSENYAVVDAAGNSVLMDVRDAQGTIDASLPSLLTRFFTLGRVGEAKKSRALAANQLLYENFNSPAAQYLRVAELAEQSADGKQFAESLEQLLINKVSGEGIKLDNVFRHMDTQEVFMQIRNASIRTLDNAAMKGFLTESSVHNFDRLKLLSASNDYVVTTLDPKTNALSFVSTTKTVQQLKKHAVDSFNLVSGGAHEIDQFAKIVLHAKEGSATYDVSKLVTVDRPPLFKGVPFKAYKISDSMRAELLEKGIYVVNNETVDSVHKQLRSRGLNFGVLLGSKDIKGVPKILRPDFAYFVTKSGEILIGTKHDDVTKLLQDVFKEGPRNMQEFGVMTTGKVIVSGLFINKIAKLGAGELKMMEARLKDLAAKFKAVGLADSTVIQAHVGFDNAVWRAMYGERITIGDILSDKFKLKIPKEMLGHAVDNSVTSPSRYIDVNLDNATGVVGIKRYRFSDPRLQALFDKLSDSKDEIYLKEVQAGLPVSYYESYWGRSITREASEAMQQFALKHPSKQSNSWKNIESFFKGRVWTDLTTVEVNKVLKILAKDGKANPADVIVQVVKDMRDGYILKPTPELVKGLQAVSKMLPEGLDFFYVHPIYSLALRFEKGVKALTRLDVVNSLKKLDVAVWSGTAKELNNARIGVNPKLASLDRQIDKLDQDIVSLANKLNDLNKATPDIKTIETSKLEQQIRSLIEQSVSLKSSKAGMVDKIANTKVMDMMVDLNAEDVYISGEEAMRLLNKGVISETDIIGDLSDSFVKLPIKKFESHLDDAGTEIFLFPKEVGLEVQRYFKSTTKEGFDKILGLWDDIHSAWRTWTLFPIPSYHIRNAISNMFMAWLGGVTDPQSYKLSFQIMQLMTSHRKGILSRKEVSEALDAMSFISANGSIMSGHQLLSSFIHNGGLSGGLHINEFTKFGNLKRQSDFTKLASESGLLKSSDLSGSWIFDNSLIRTGVSAAAFVENRFRLATFIDAFRRGHVERNGGAFLTGTDAAAMHMKKVFYDYNDLSAFEQSWLRRVFPFYAWSRHNVPRMVTTLVTDPMKHYKVWKFIDDLERGVVGREVTEAELPEWVREKYGMIISKTAEGSYVVKTADGFLPLFDAYKAISRGGLMTMAKDGLTPFVKTPIEQLMNLSTYSGQDIEKFPGQEARSFSLGSVGFTRRVTNEGPLGPLNIILNESLFKTFFRPGAELVTKVLDPILDPRNFGKEKPSVLVNTLALFIGRSYMVDPDKAKAAFYRNWKKKEGQLMALRNSAYKIGDTSSVEQMDSMINWLRIGYPGVNEL